MTGCSAKNCSNHSRHGYRHFRFPSNPERRQQWIINSRREEGWFPTNSAKLCEAHFEESQFEKNRRDGRKILKPFAVPTLFDLPKQPRCRRRKASSPLALSTDSAVKKERNEDVEEGRGDHSYCRDNMEESVEGFEDGNSVVNVLRQIVESFGSAEEDFLFQNSQDTLKEDIEELRKDDEIAGEIALACWKMQESLYNSWDQRFADSDFFATFRVSKTLYKFLVEEWEKVEALNHCNMFLVSQPLDKQVLAALYYFGSFDRVVAAADRFSMVPSTYQKAVCNFINFLVRWVDKYIYWPDPEERMRLAEVVRKNGGLPGTFGAMDTALIKIRAPVGDEKMRYTYKKSPTGPKCAVAVQFVVDSDLMFRDIYLDAPNTATCSQMMQHSTLWEILNKRIAPETHLVAPDVYPLAPAIMTPYDTAHPSSQEAAFNRSHGAAFKLTRNAMSILKSRFRRLLFLDQKLSNVYKTIKSAFVLHNISLLKEGSEVLEELELDYNSATDREDWHSLSQQETVADYSILGGEEKRLYLTTVMS